MMDRTNALPLLLLLSPLWTHLLPAPTNTGGVVLVEAAVDDSGLTWQPRRGYDEVGVAGRHHPITFANETHGFLLTGSTASTGSTSDFIMYDESTDEWIDITDTSPFPGKPRSFGYGVVLNEPGNTKAYVGFGASDIQLFSDLWEFDMSSHTWTELAEFPGPGRRHPAMNAVLVGDGRWRIHVGLGDGIVNGGFSNMNDWWSYDVDTDVWTELPDFPSSKRHHPFYFALGEASYAGLGHSDGFDPYIERDWYRFDYSNTSGGALDGDGGSWVREGDFESWDDDPFSGGSIVTTEARVAGTQFSIDFSPYSGGNDTNLTGALGFVLSGDGDDHGPMETGEFHAFYAPPSAPSSSKSRASWWRRLPPHPGRSRWAPGSFVIRGTARAYFTSGYDRTTGILHADLWTIDLSPLFLIPSNTTTTANGTDTIMGVGGDDTSGHTTEEGRSPIDDEEEEREGSLGPTVVATSSEVGSSLGSSGSTAFGSRSVVRNYPVMGAAVALLLSYFTLNN